jgi:hypothetical protein
MILLNLHICKSEQQLKPHCEEIYVTDDWFNIGLPNYILFLRKSDATFQKKSYTFRTFISPLFTCSFSGKTYETDFAD